MPKYDFRILIETQRGKKFSYISSSFVDTNTAVAVSSSVVWGRITSSKSCSYQNSHTFNTTKVNALNVNYKFKDNIYEISL